MNLQNKILISTSLMVCAIFVCYVYIKSRKMIAPLKGKITSKFGNRIHPVTGVVTFHNGVDIKAPEGTHVVCPADGKVIQLNTTTAGGKQLIIQHTNGYKTGYAHLLDWRVNKGDRVTQGQLIALSGNTGQSTGAHLHFTVENAQGEKIDPEILFTI